MHFENIRPATEPLASRTRRRSRSRCRFFCFRGGMGGGGTYCGFTTFQQCMDTARGLGSFCQPNTQYLPPPGPHHPYTGYRRRYPY
jgi:hypothetical protein